MCRRMRSEGADPDTFCERGSSGGVGAAVSSQRRTTVIEAEAWLTRELEGCARVRRCHARPLRRHPPHGDDPHRRPEGGVSYSRATLHLMLGVIDLPTDLAGLVLIVLLPGPNSLYVLSVAARKGIRTGYTAAAGVWCGYICADDPVRGRNPASLLQANAVLFGIVKYAGAGYLTWLAVGTPRAAWGMWRTRHSAGRGERGRRGAGRRGAALPAGAGDQPVQPEGDPVLRRLLRAVRGPLRTPTRPSPSSSWCLRPARQLPVPHRADLQPDEAGGGLPAAQAALGGGPRPRRAPCSWASP